MIYHPLKQFHLEWTPPAARNSDPPTSHQAAARHPALRRLDRRRVLMAHHLIPEGMTDHELAANLGGLQTSLGKRRGELRDLGLIENSGTTRPAPSGSPAIVWKITAAGMEAVKQ